MSEIDYLAALKKAQFDFIFSAIQDVYLHLEIEEILKADLSIIEICEKLNISGDCLRRFLNALCYLGVCRIDDDFRYHHKEVKKYDADLSELLIKIINTGIVTEIGKRAQTTVEELTAELDLDNKIIDKLVRANLIIVENNYVKIPEKTIKYLSPNSPDYIGAIINHYERIMHPMFATSVIVKALREERSQWKYVFGVNVTNQFDAYDDEPELLRLFTKALHYMNRVDNEIIADIIKFNHKERILDLGGGSGSLAVSITKKSLSSTVDIYELEQAIPILVSVLSQCEEKNDRIAFKAGSFLSETSEGSFQGVDVNSYGKIFLSWILHDWSDETCVEILSRAKRHLKPNGFLYILECMLPPSRVSHDTVLDIAMLLQTEGKERTLDEFKVLLYRAGFKTINYIHSSTRRKIIEAA